MFACGNYPHRSSSADSPTGDAEIDGTDGTFDGMPVDMETVPDVRPDGWPDALADAPVEAVPDSGPDAGPDASNDACGPDCTACCDTPEDSDLCEDDDFVSCTCINGGTLIVEFCDNLDNDCNATIDDGCDNDDDNYCDQDKLKAFGVTVSTCSATSAAAGVGDDCNDSNGVVFPGAEEICDNLVNDCAAGEEWGAGNLLWAKRAGGFGQERPTRVAAFPDGSVMLVGGFAGTATFGPGESAVTTLTSAGLTDVFLARYDADGTLLFARRAGGVEYDFAVDLAVLADGTVMVVGHFSGTATFGPGESVEVELTSVGDDLFWEVFLVRYDGDGALIWARHAAQGLEAVKAAAVSGFGDGSVAILGMIEGATTLGVGESEETVLSSSGMTDAFVAKYDSSGMLTVAKLAVGGTEYQVPTGMAALTDGSVWLSGYCGGTVTYGPGEVGEIVLPCGIQDSFVAKYDAGGAPVLVTDISGPDVVFAADIAAAPDGGAVVVGGFTSAGSPGTATFGAGEAGETILTSMGASDAFVAKYDPAGELIFARGVGGVLEDGADAVATLPDGSVLIGGAFDSPATFGAGEEGVTVLDVVASGGTFLAKYRPDGSLAFAKGSDGGLYMGDVSGIATLFDGTAVVAGPFEGSATFGVGETSETVLSWMGAHDVFVAKYDVTEDPDVGCDDDDDGYCDATMTKAPDIAVTVCPLTSPAATTGDDCDDSSASVYPGMGCL